MKGQLLFNFTLKEFGQRGMILEDTEKGGVLSPRLTSTSMCGTIRIVRFLVKGGQMIQLASDVTQEFVDAGLKAITDLQTVGGYNTIFFGNNGLNPIIGNTHSARFLFLWLCEVEGITHFERMIPIIAVSPMYYDNGYNRANGEDL